MAYFFVILHKPHYTMVLEYFLTLFFILICFFALYKIKMFGAKGISKHWFAASFGLKLIAAGFMIWIYSNSDRNKADIFRFYDDATIISQAAFTDTGNYLKMITGIGDDNAELDKYYSKTNNWYSGDKSKIISNNHFIIRYLSFISLLTFGSYGATVVLTVFFAFTGLFWVFRFFYSRLPDKKWLIFFVVFFTPSLVFWTSGLLKESLIIGFIGLSLNCGGFALKGRQPIARLIIFFISLVFLFQLRAISASLWILAILPFVWNYYRPKQNAFISYFIFIFIAFSLASESQKIITNGVYDILVQKKQAFEQLAVDNQAGSFIETSNLEPSTISMLKNIPEALGNTLFRPYPWEVKNPIMALALVENILILAMLLLAIIVRQKKIYNYNLVYFTFIFAFSYFIIIGLTVPVLGAISRYRVIPLLFFELGLIQLINTNKISTLLKWSK